MARGERFVVTGGAGFVGSHLCEALLASDHPGPINLGNPHEISMRELAVWIRTLSGSASELRFIESPGDDPKMRRPDIAAAREVLGWEPGVAAEEGLRRTIDWFRLEEVGGGGLTPSLIYSEEGDSGAARGAGLGSAR